MRLLHNISSRQTQESINRWSTVDRDLSDVRSINVRIGKAALIELGQGRRKQTKKQIFSYHHPFTVKSDNNWCRRRASLAFFVAFLFCPPKLYYDDSQSCPVLRVDTFLTLNCKSVSSWWDRGFFCENLWFTFSSVRCLKSTFHTSRSDHRFPLPWST